MAKQAPDADKPGGQSRCNPHLRGMKGSFAAEPTEHFYVLSITLNPYDVPNRSPGKPKPMRQRLLTQLLQVPHDLDYVESFQELSRMNLEIRRHGPSAQRLLRKATLERAVGNHAASLVACQDALVLDPNNPEMHYQVGIAFMFLALAKADALPVGPSPTDVPNDSVAALLSKAIEAFRTVLRHNPRDQDAREDVSAIQKVLAAHVTDEQLGEALRTRNA